VKNKSLIIVGLGETALLAYEYFTHDSEYEVVAFAAGREFITQDSLCGRKVIPLEDLATERPPDTCTLFVAISSGKLNRDRARVYGLLKAQGYFFASYVSSRAFVWHDVEIGENCFILENNTLQPFVKIGNNVTIWSGNHIGHRTIVKDDCFVSSHCVISGFCELGRGSFLGVNCTIEDHVVIGEDNFIGARALIQKDTGARGLYQETQTEISKVSTHRLFRIKES
jgi:sugar O-acyltransferase (sialic acid O-acetyltransferase NeuD family)